MSLLDLLSSMTAKRKPVVTQKRPPTQQTMSVVEILNINNGCEMETAEIARLAGLKRDTVSKIMQRLEKQFHITSRITTSSERKKGKHSKTKVKKWICHKLIGTK